MLFRLVAFWLNRRAATAWQLNIALSLYDFLAHSKKEEKMKIKSIVFSGILASAVFAAGCASIMHGTTEKIGISSQPTGANVEVDNKPLGTTPVFADLKRDSEHVVTIQMPGYQKSQLTITKSVSGWAWGNIVFGGLIGLAVDSISGGLYKLSPEQVNADLQKNDAKTTAYYKKGVYVVAVLKPNPQWHKIGELSRE